MRTVLDPTGEQRPPARELLALDVAETRLVVEHEYPKARIQDKALLTPILQGSIARHWRAWGAMGIAQRVAGEAAIGRTVAELADADATLSAMVAAGRRLRDAHGADVLVMGCAGMAAFRAPLSEATGLPVVEPTQAAVSMILGRIQLGW